jgi:hypothetical protein
VHEENDPAQRASALMKRGLARLDEGTPESVAESLEHFDEALALRRALPPSEDPWASHVLAASWMNRGDALTRLGAPENLAEAVRSYDEALAVLRAMPLDANPLFRRRFAIAWINRGITLLEQGTSASLPEAVRSFNQGIAALAHVVEESVLVACAWMNRANALFRHQPPLLEDAHQSAYAALALLGRHESGDLIAAESGLKARHIICQVVAESLSTEAADPEALIAAAYHAVESGLRLARDWEQRGETRFRPLATGLFHFGTALCQRHQPATLAAFLRENVGTVESVDTYAAACQALARSWQDAQKGGFAAVNTPRLEQWIEILRTWRATHSRLRELHAALRSPKNE